MTENSFIYYDFNRQNSQELFMLMACFARDNKQIYEFLIALGTWLYVEYGENNRVKMISLKMSFNSRLTFWSDGRTILKYNWICVVKIRVLWKKMGNKYFDFCSFLGYTWSLILIEGALRVLLILQLDFG